jgi:uncharacterized protein (TIGR03790 family)
MKARLAIAGKMRGTALLWLVLIAVGGAQPPRAVEPFPAAARNTDADATLVVFNEMDDESRDLAKFYAAQRGIASARVLGLKCATSEEISRDDYEHTIAEPLRRAFTSNFWWKLRDPNSVLGAVESNKIRFIALIRGIPLKIANSPGYPGDRIFGDPPIGNHNDAAVDSELATLGSFSREISGALNNPYYRGFARFEDLRRPEMMLVCRLDGPSAATVRRMIQDSIFVEREGLAGFAYLDARGIESGAYKEGDDWLLAAANSLRRQGLPVILDNGPELFPESYPMRQAAVYYGWYTSDVAGPFVRPGFRFARGAVAVHIHSFSGTTVRDPKRAWVAPLLQAGAAATMGNVYEPYLTLTPHLDVFHDRLRAGFTFAEAAYMSQRVLSWMTTCVGDPLYRPFAGAEVAGEKPATGEWAEYRAGAKLWYAQNPAAGAAALQAAGKKLRSGVIFEGLGLLQLTANNSAAAIAAFQQARQFYKQPDDVARVAIHEIIQLRATQHEAEATALMRKIIAANPQGASVPMLRTFEPPLEPSPVPAR